MSKETEFTVFCMESYKVYKSLSGKQVYDLFRQYDVFDYIREFYDVLHTTSYQYINLSLIHILVKSCLNP